MSHTPGPWNLTEDSGDCDVPISCQIGIDSPAREEEGFDTYLATVVHGDPDELIANARLIAAAPDLLAALESLAQAISLQAIRDRADPEMLEGWRKLQAQADAALSKARGQ